MQLGIPQSCSLWKHQEVPAVAGPGATGGEKSKQNCNECQR